MSRTHPDSQPERQPPKPPSPPRWADRLLEWFVAPHLLEYVQGDLQEVFYKRVQQVGLADARREYGWAVMHCLTPFFHNRTVNQYPNPAMTDMLRNYFTIAWRNLMRHRGFTTLNVLGLSVGVASALLLFMAVRYQSSFDTFHPDYERIYSVVRKQVYANGNEELSRGNPLPVEAALKNDIPQFEAVVPVFGTLDPYVTVLGSKPDASMSANKFVEDDEGLLVKPEFFNVFNFRWLIGQPNVLAQPNVVVLSETYAKKYFTDTQQAVGKFLRINNLVTMRVVGVLADPPKNTDLPLNLVISYASKQAKPEWFGANTFNDWGSANSSDQIFVRLPPNFSPESANKLLEGFSRKHYNEREDNIKKSHFLSPLADYHHDDRFSVFSAKTMPVPRQRIWNMATVGVLILLMACINFINISSALATKRAKEVGVRKVLGSQKSQLVIQFLSETFLVVLAALTIGVGLACVALPLLSQLFGIPADPSLHFRPDLGLALLGLLLVVTLLSGLYPALVLSSFSPLAVFRQPVASGWGRGITLRQSLIVVQFTAALVLIISTVVNLRQMGYLSRLSLGFVKEGVYNFGMDTEYRPRNATLRNELLRIPGVSDVAFSSDVPSSDNKWTSNFAFTNSSKNEDFAVSLKMVNGSYFSTFGMTFLAGGPYAADDTVRKFVVNETLLKKLSVKNPEAVIGREMRLFNQLSKIVGVVKDFHTNSAREGIQPVLMMAGGPYFSGSVKLQSKNLPQTIDQIKAVYAKVFPEVAFSGQFYDESLRNYYKAEEQMGLLYRVFAALTIFVACLGLFGLAAFTTEQRTKEIGVRKVLGASVTSIVALLSKDFLRLVVMAIVLATPIAWYLMHRWLQDFVYQIGIEWWVFALAGILAVVITLMTVGFQSVKAALLDPVESLRSE
ncbi:MAG: ABC transporter permease [Bacteroidetes bacterium]|nr:ABC transporter permease [Fibrella sp.]